MRVVLDVTILASASVFPDRKSGIVLQLAQIHQFELVLSEPIMELLAVVLTRQYFCEKLSETARLWFLHDLRCGREMETPHPEVRGIAPDLEDDLVLGTAVAANAGFLVTGDKRLLALREFCGVRIVTADEFLRELGLA